MIEQQQSRCHQKASNTSCSKKALSNSKATWRSPCHHIPASLRTTTTTAITLEGKGGESSWGDKNAQQLVPLYEKYGVDIALTVTSKLRTTWRFWMTINQKKGVRYITSGGAVGHLETAAPQRAWFSLHYKTAYHICYASSA